MKKKIPGFKNAILFKGIPQDAFETVLESLDSQLKHYRAGQVILSSGAKIRRAGIIMEGTLTESITTFWGNQTILFTYERGSLFAENVACIKGACSEVDYIAVTPCVILWVNLKDIMNLDIMNVYRTTMLENLMSAMAERDLFFQSRLHHMSITTTRDKLLSYLSEQAVIHQSDSFDIPFDRQDLADYLGVERSAMSAELSKLKRSGYLDYKKNHFELIRPSKLD